MSMHEDFSRERDAKGSSDRGFGLVFTIVFAAIGLWPLDDGAKVRWWALASGAAILAVALATPTLLGPANRLWHKFGLLLHRVTNPLRTGVIS